MTKEVPAKKSAANAEISSNGNEVSKLVINLFLIL
jgi:hypothetical protein